MIALVQKASALAPVPLLRWWSLKAPRERRVLAALAVVVVAAFAFVAVWMPLKGDLVALRSSVPALREQLANAQRLSGEVAGLARNAPVARPPVAPAVVEQVLAQRGIPAGTAQINWEDGRARLTLASIPFDTLVAALDALQRDTGLRPVEVTLTARVEPGTVRAELLLAR